MNKFVRVAGIAVASVLVVAGTVWAQAGLPAGLPAGSQWKPPQGTFPNMSEITVPIDTGDISQDRGGTIDFSKSSSTSYSLKFPDLKGGIIVAGAGQLPISGNLSFVTGTQSGIVFTDGSYQTSSGKFQSAKFCRVVIQPYNPGNGYDVMPTGPVYDTVPARDSWKVSDCINYAKDMVPAGSGYTYPVMIGCEYPSGFGFGAPSAAGYYDPTTLPMNCGWDVPPPPPPPVGTPLPPDKPTCYFRQNLHFFSTYCNIP